MRKIIKIIITHFAYLLQLLTLYLISCVKLKFYHLPIKSCNLFLFFTTQKLFNLLVLAYLRFLIEILDLNKLQQNRIHDYKHQQILFLIW
jgi:hypothetical protein